MVRVIRISTPGDLDYAVKTLNRIKRQLPEMTRLGMRRWGNILVKDMKNAAKQDPNNLSLWL